MRKIEEIRAELDAVDEEFLKVYQKRMSLVAEMAKAKKDSGAPTSDTTREQAIVRRLEENAGALAPYVGELYEAVFSTSKRYQNALRGEDER